MDHAYFLAPSSFCFHFLKKEEVNEREKRMIPFSPVPAPSLSERKKEEEESTIFHSYSCFQKEKKRERETSSAPKSKNM